ncbi:DNA polymerase epsilon subunit 2 [Blyttiomyces sp. JEL0837]|nr:DNA polymerase epsilon subunit 2 [Blyttiomyces sp. JEL0837]
MSYWRKAVQIFSKKYGFSLRADALQSLKKFLAEREEDGLEEEDLPETIAWIAAAYIQHQGSKSKLISGAYFDEVLQSITTKVAVNHALENADDAEFDDLSSYFHVINVFDVPRWIYSWDTKTFVRVVGQFNLLASASVKTAMTKDRYDLLLQRIKRNERFRNQSFGKGGQDSFEITPIKNLNGRKSGSFVLFGMLTQMCEGKHHLEDGNSFIELDFSGKTTIEQIEKAATDISFVIISDVWLDQPRVMAKLRVLFQGYSEAIIPLAFILIGNFTSTPYINTSACFQHYKEVFDSLADLIAEFPLIAKSQIVFVPGPTDPGSGGLLPRPPIPKSFTAKILAKVPTAKFTSNPCRLKYCSQEIVVFREDLMSKMLRNCILPPNKEVDAEMKRHTVRILDSVCFGVGTLEGPSQETY